jgi:hypothetical protein
MSMNKPALACTLAAAALAALAVAEHAVGLGLAVVLLLTLAAGVLAAGRHASPALTALAVALAMAPLVRDAGWVVALDALGAVVAGGGAVGRLGSWAALRRALPAPWRWLAGLAVVRRGLAAAWPRPAGRKTERYEALARGFVLAFALLFVFGGLFVAADSAFADIAGDVVDVHIDVAVLIWRGVLALACAAVAGALARSAVVPVAAGPPVDPARRLPGTTELRLALGATVALFAAFVAVQLRVLFGGASYVEQTTGLGYGDYARHGFVELLLIAALTLCVVAVGARSRDRAVRGLLAALCVLTLVVLASAEHRIELVQDAYGMTRVRLAGQAVVLWIAALLTLILAGGLRRRLARHLPRAVAIASAAGLVAFTIINPDARIADSAVHRARSGHALDVEYLSGLSADALPAFERLPPGVERNAIVGPIRERLEEGDDGVAGFNLSRAAQRR